MEKIKKILVTGATGFLGRYIVQELVSHGYQVLAFGRNQKIGTELLEERVQFVKGDFTSWSEINQVVSEVDAVVHAGALSTIWGKWHDFYETNVLGTEYILKACEAHHIERLVFISSPSIYAGPKDQLNILENEAPKNNELNNYIKSKLLAEEKIKKYQTVPSVVLRPRGLFGIGDTSIIPRLLNIHKKIGIPLFNNGEQVVDVTCVENVALSVRLSLESNVAVGQTYNITNGEPMPFKEIFDQLLAELQLAPSYLSLNYSIMYGLSASLETIYRLFQINKEPAFTKYTIYLLRYSQTLSIVKAQTELNYHPILSIKEGIKKYAEHYRTS